MEKQAEYNKNLVKYRLSETSSMLHNSENTFCGTAIKYMRDFLTKKEKHMTGISAIISK